MSRAEQARGDTGWCESDGLSDGLSDVLRQIPSCEPRVQRDEGAHSIANRGQTARCFWAGRSARRDSRIAPPVQSASLFTTDIPPRAIFYGFAVFGGVIPFGGEWAFGWIFEFITWLMGFILLPLVFCLPTGVEEEEVSPSRVAQRGLKDGSVMIYIQL